MSSARVGSFIGPAGYYDNDLSTVHPLNNSIIPYDTRTAEEVAAATAAAQTKPTWQYIPPTTQSPAGQPTQVNPNRPFAPPTGVPYQSTPKTSK